MDQLFDLLIEDMELALGEDARGWGFVNAAFYIGVMLGAFLATAAAGIIVGVVAMGFLLFRIAFDVVTIVR